MLQLDKLNFQVLVNKRDEADWPGEFVTPSELPLASSPVAAVRLLSAVRPHVRLQMRTLRVPAILMLSYTYFHTNELIYES